MLILSENEFPYEITNKLDFTDEKQYEYLYG